jgi:hypothetical protein
MIPLAAPPGGCIKKCRSYGLIVDGLEETEEAHPIAVCLIVELVADRRDAADHLPVAFGEEVFGFGVLEERIFAAGKQ